jgi:hypothetical protein
MPHHLSLTNVKAAWGLSRGFGVRFHIRLPMTPDDNFQSDQWPL